MHSNRPFLLFVIPLLALGLLLGGCAKKQTPAAQAVAPVTYPLVATDDSGASVTIPAKPQRIVSLTLFTDDVLLEIVDHARLIAVTSFSADPAISNVADKVKDIPNKLVMNVELLVSLAADLVLVANWTEAEKVKQLRDAGIPVFLVATGVTVGQIGEKIATVSRLVGESERGAQLAAAMEAKLSEVAKRVAKVPADKRLSVVDYTVWGSAQGRGSSWDEIVTRAGLVNGVGSIPADQYGQVPLSKEKLLELDPDLLILPGWTYDDPKGAEDFFQKTTADPVLKGLQAIRGGRAYQMPERLKTTTSQYIAEAVLWLAKTAYPAQFK